MEFSQGDYKLGFLWMCSSSPMQWCGSSFIAHRGRGHRLFPYNLRTKVYKYGLSTESPKSTMDSGFIIALWPIALSLCEESCSG
jgi:hypothetical protein